MKQVLLDTNFIISCARQKIDFFEEIPGMGLEILIPKQVFDEIKKLSKSRKSALVREEADLALKILNKNKFTLIKLRRNDVDKAIKEFADENKSVIIATLDKELKDKIQNQKMIIRGVKTLEII
jgi:rRNA-processing protein FCF1